MASYVEVLKKIEAGQLKPKVNSVLIRVDELKPERVDGIRRAAENAALAAALSAMGEGTAVVIRDLTPTDLGETNEEWLEVTGVDNTWTSVLTSAPTTIADSRFICITGCRIVCATATGGILLEPGITLLRFTVGGAVNAIWNLYPLFAPAGAATGAGSSAIVMPAGISETPIGVSQNIGISIHSYGVETTVIRLALDGIVCEKEGLRLKA